MLQNLSCKCVWCLLFNRFYTQYCHSRLKLKVASKHVNSDYKLVFWTKQDTLHQTRCHWCTGSLNCLTFRKKAFLHFVSPLLLPPKVERRCNKDFPLFYLGLVLIQKEQQFCLQCVLMNWHLKNWFKLTIERCRKSLYCMFSHNTQ